MPLFLYTIEFIFIPHSKEVSQPFHDPKHIRKDQNQLHILLKCPKYEWLAEARVPI